MCSAMFSGFINTCLIQIADKLHFVKISEDFDEVTLNLVDNDVDKFTFSRFCEKFMIVKKNGFKEIYLCPEKSLQPVHRFDKNDILDSSLRIALKSCESHAKKTGDYAR